jgi:hypothetical protein
LLFGIRLHAFDSLPALDAITVEESA